ncbi:MAG: PaaX family transcriptional regulator C-terminal domain-containing protein [Bosea sp. (in: a-proteobacteria)]
MTESLPPAPALPAQVATLVEAFHQATPPRTWSLIVTAFGDMVGETRAPLPLGAITALLSLAHVDAGSVRTALSRLVASGILVRDKQGRSSLYAAASAQQEAFRQAAGLIYGRALPQATGFLQLMALEANGADAAAKAALETQGFRQLQPRLMVRPEHADVVLAPAEGAVTFLASAGPEHSALLEPAFGIARLSAGYRSFVALHAPLAQDLPEDPAAAALARLMLVHAFRRLVLRDPFLPSAVLPADWQGAEARVLFDKLHGVLSPVAAPWLAEQGFPPTD